MSILYYYWKPRVKREDGLLNIIRSDSYAINSGSLAAPKVARFLGRFDYLAESTPLEVLAWVSMSKNVNTKIQGQKSGDQK